MAREVVDPEREEALTKTSEARALDSTEATTGLEPVMRVLQTLALPLGHVARNIKPAGKRPAGYCLSGRRDSNSRPSPWQGDVLPLNYTRVRRYQIVPGPRLELGTPAFSVQCSTN